MGSLDLTMAYGQVHLDNRYKKIFQFTWRGQFYCYVTLPQGFSDSPRMFVRITSPLMAYLRDRLIDILIYIDDTFLRAPTVVLLSHNLRVTLDLFGKCGLLVNTQKSCTVPTQKMEFLGFLFDSVAYTIAVTNDKHRSLLTLITKVVNKPRATMTVRHLAKIIGKIVAIFPACLQAKLHYRTLERYKTKMVLLHRSWSKQIKLSTSCLHEFDWWFQFLKKGPIVKSLTVRNHTVEIYSDASGFGYGSTWDGLEVQGLFTECQKCAS